jgi:gamma-glutamyltranspeptidase/glutathione hydrolase
VLALVCSLVAQAARPYRGGVVATAYAPATEAGLAMLNKGGNAVDAAVAAAFVAGIAGPYHNGLGGGGFALVYDAKQKSTRALDFREVAPAAASRDMFVKEGKLVPGLSMDGATSVAVPGAVAGYLLLQKTYGKLKLQDVLAPAIHLAERGIWVTPKYQSMAQMRLSCLRKDPEAARLFLRPNSQGAQDVPGIGTALPNPELAKTLRRIAEKGAPGFYEGEVAKALVSTVGAGSGALSLEDLRRFTPRWREPLWGSYRGHPIATMPPPSAGGLAILQVLGQLEVLKPQAFPHGDVSALHALIEAMRRSYADRAQYLGDPAFVDVPVTRLLSADHLKMLASSIDVSHATSSRTLGPRLAPTGSGAGSVTDARSGPGAPDSGVPRKNTTHLSVIDKDGNAVALTTTINYAFGSCVVARGTGVLLNDEMDDFAAQPLTPNVFGLVTGEANAIAPGKIPLSSMSPTFVFQTPEKDRVLLATGSPGGPTIPTAVLQVISNVLDQGLDLQRAVTSGRLHEQWLPDVVKVEPWTLDAATKDALLKMGHTFETLPVIGDTESVGEDPSTHLHYAASDPRGEGLGLGQE